MYSLFLTEMMSKIFEVILELLKNKKLKATF